MDLTEKLVPIRKGLLEFVILKIVAGDKVHVADIPKVAGAHRVRHPGRHALSAAQQVAARGTGRLRVAGTRGGPAAQVLQADSQGPLAAFNAQRLLEEPEPYPRRFWELSHAKRGQH